MSILIGQKLVGNAKIEKLKCDIFDYLILGCNVNNTFWPMDCPDLTVPKSLLKVKVWYDNGFLESKQVQTHEKAKEYIYATMAHVQHFMCSSSIGTILQTEVKSILRLFQCFQFYFFSWLKSNTCKIFTSIQPPSSQSKI